MDIKNSVLNYINYEQINWYDHVRIWMKKGYLRNFGKNKKEKISKFVEAGSNNWNERERA